MILYVEPMEFVGEAPTLADVATKCVAFDAEGRWAYTPGSGYYLVTVRDDGLLGVAVPDSDPIVVLNDHRIELSPEVAEELRRRDA